MGSLTGVQLEIMEAVWASGRRGATVAEVRDRLAPRRDLARTTVLTLVQRLAQRRWLKRRKYGRSHRYVATRTREQTTGQLAAEFVEEFFNGSAAKLVMSLIGSKNIDPTEVARLRRILGESDKEDDQ
jgi:predicted transcriptional regulator